MNSVFVTIAPAIEAFTSAYWPGLKRGERDHQFGQVAKRCVQKPADRIAGVLGDQLRRAAQERCKRDDGKDRQHEEQRLPIVPGVLAVKHHRHEDQKPQKRRRADVCQKLSACPSPRCRAGAAIPNVPMARSLELVARTEQERVRILEVGAGVVVGIRPVADVDLQIHFGERLDGRHAQGFGRRARRRRYRCRRSSRSRRRSVRCAIRSPFQPALA